MEQEKYTIYKKKIKSKSNLLKTEGPDGH